MSFVSLITFFGGSNSYNCKNQNITDLKKCKAGHSVEAYSTSKKCSHFDNTMRLESLNYYGPGHVQSLEKGN